MKFFVRLKPFLLLLLCSTFLPASTQAHHSFAVHFVPEGIVSVTGVVDSFRFSNPHGILQFTVTDENGVAVPWRAETNSPNILRRRGWTPTSIKPGQLITVEGYPARDGSQYMRISKVVFEDGSELVGQARSAAPADQD